MQIKEFVYSVLGIPVSLNGFALVCEAITYVVEHDDSKFHPHLQRKTEKSYACIEKNIKLAREKSFSAMSDELKEKIYGGVKEPILNKEFIWFAAQHYQKEYMNEDKES